MLHLLAIAIVLIACRILYVSLCDSKHSFDTAITLFMSRDSSVFLSHDAMYEISLGKDGKKVAIGATGSKLT